MNKLKEGQIYTLNDGQTYDVIHRHFEDGSGSWCYEIVIMQEVIYEGKVIWSKDLIGCSIEWENCALDTIRKYGVLVGQLGKTHFFNPNNYKLEKLPLDHSSAA